MTNPCTNCPYKPHDERAFQVWAWDKILELENSHAGLWAELEAVKELLGAVRHNTHKAYQILYRREKPKVRRGVER